MRRLNASVLAFDGTDAKDYVGPLREFADWLEQCEWTEQLGGEPFIVSLAFDDDPEGVELIVTLTLLDELLDLREDAS